MAILSRIKRGLRKGWKGITKSAHARGRGRSGVAILMYHRVADPICDPWELCVSPTNFDIQLAMLRARFQVITPTDLGHAMQERSVPERAVVITFDDGYADNLIHAKPLLEKHRLPATLFLTSNALDSPAEFWWDELERTFLHPGALPDKVVLTIGGKTKTWNLQEASTYTEAEWERERTWIASMPPRNPRQQAYYEIWSSLRAVEHEEQQLVLEQLRRWAGTPSTAREEYRTLTKAEAHELVRGDSFQLGAHTITHPALPFHSKMLQDREIRGSKVLIEAEFGTPALHFAYPYGDHSEETARVVREAGFQTAFTTRSGLAEQGTSRWELPRVCVRNVHARELEAQIAHVFGL